MTKVMECWNTPDQLGIIAFDVIRNDLHRPIKDGQCNRENVEDGILDGVYKGELPAMNKSDVEFVCQIVDELIQLNIKK